MGSHAVRYYGLDRNTIDYDLHLSPANWDDPGSRLNQSTLTAGQPLTPGLSWRTGRKSREVLPIKRIGEGRLAVLSATQGRTREDVRARYYEYQYRNTEH